MSVTFPTSSTALIQLKDGDYHIIQLEKTVDQAVKAREETKGQGSQTEADDKTDVVEESSKVDGLAPGPSAPDQEDARPANLVHFHTLAMEIALSPPKPQVRRLNPESGRQEQMANPDRERFDAIRETARTSFEPATPFILIPEGDTALAVPVDRRGNVLTRSTGFQVLLPSNLKRANVTPLLNHVVYPYDQYSKDWFISTNTWDTANWIHAAIALDPRQPTTRKGTWRPEHQKVYLTSDLKACWIPDEADAEAEGELKLVLTINAHLDMNHLFDPLHEIASDLMGLILHSLVPSPTSMPPMSDSERRADALRHFFASVRPAPPVPYARSLQPSDMVSKLLPFQNRTVALLVQRERSDARAAQSAQGARDGSWTAVSLDGKAKVAYNRLTGGMVKLSDEQPSRSAKGKGVDRVDEHGFTPAERLQLAVLIDLSDVKGTMLCEEMGLGKTVEAIALLLLNRHPLSTKRVTQSHKREQVDRPLLNQQGAGRLGMSIPTINLAQELDLTDDDELCKWWHKEKQAFKDAVRRDDRAELDVTQVAATLIVTPPSLLKQWVAEMAVHAPSLRVCVYEGWKSLLDGVHQRTMSDNRQRKEQERITAKRKRDNQRQRAETVKKYQKGSSGQAVKVEPESTVEDDQGETDENGLPPEDLQARTQRLFVDFVRAHDVVITTYGELSKDLTVALRAPPRSRRTNVNYRTGDRPRSPLVMVEWWRVLMDEVQLCGDSSAAANMVSLIPRQNSLAVSGTPAKTDLKDLMGSLKFLRVPTLPYEPRLWHRLQQAPMRPAFDSLFQTIAIRTTKKEVSGEFNLPHQTRFVIPIELSEIEMHYYNDTLERQRVVLGLPPDPNDPRPDDWYLDTVLFRSCLQNLRQICTHIQVGQMAGGPGGRVGRDRARLRLGRELMTSAEALSRISEDHEVERMLTSRAQLRAMIRKAQLLLIVNEDDRENRAILALYERVRHKVNIELESIRQHLADLLRGREASVIDLDDEDDSEDGDKNISQQERDLRSELQHTRSTIRELLLILHQSYFFEGDVRHMQTEVEQEVACYEQAEATRKEILARPLQVANTTVDMLQQKPAVVQAMQAVDDLQVEHTDRKSGILSHDPITQSNELLKIMNDNALLITVWRTKIMDLLTTPIDQGATDLPSAKEDQNVEDPEKEQYAEALKAQGEVEAYLIAYSSAIADRREMMLEERSMLAQHDARVKKLRTTNAAAQALADSEIPPDVPNDVAQLAGQLMSERQTMRDAREMHDCQRPLKQMLMSLNNIVHGGARPEEVVIAKHAADAIRELIHKQTEHLEKLNKELDVFRKTFNRRVIYFAALQEISDSVAAPVLHKKADVGLEIKKTEQDINKLEGVLARSQIRGRYLKFLASREDAENIHDDCLICIGSSDDTHGIILDCGHFFCDACFTEFRKSALGTKCPQCRTTIEPASATRFRLGSKPNEAAAQVAATDPGPSATDEAVTNPETAQKPTEAVEAVLPTMTAAQLEREARQVDLDRLNTMSVDARREIALMDMMGDYGSKINFLIKHLLWYRIRDASARHVVFSNWSDSLRIVIQALQANGIKFVSFDRGGRLGGDVVEKFQQDDSITVFLLHAERESAGLTLTSCRVVHLLEPVLKHSFELQAIGRVDRLGQKQETSVYCYATQDTVESRILSQGVRNGTSIYLKEEEQGDQVVEDLDNVVGAAHKGGDIGLDGNEQEMLQLIML